MRADLVTLLSAISVGSPCPCGTFSALPQSEQQRGSEDVSRARSRYPKDTGIDRTPAIRIRQPSVICCLLLPPLFIYPLIQNTKTLAVTFSSI